MSSPGYSRIRLTVVCVREVLLSSRLCYPWSQCHIVPAPYHQVRIVPHQVDVEDIPWYAENFLSGHLGNPSQIALCIDF